MTQHEQEIIVAIACRANRELRMGKIVVALDLAHCMEHQPLDLEKLYSFPALDFAHDIYGIHANLHTGTHTLKNCFLPRCAN